MTSDFFALCFIVCRIGHLKIFQKGGSRLEDIIVEGGQPNDDKKQTKGGGGSKMAEIW